MMKSYDDPTTDGDLEVHKEYESILAQYESWEKEHGSGAIITLTVADRKRKNDN